MGSSLAQIGDIMAGGIHGRKASDDKVWEPILETDQALHVLLQAYDTVTQQNDAVQMENGNLQVYIADQTTHIVDMHAVLEEGTFTLASPTVPDTYTITVEAGHGITIGDTIEFYENDDFSHYVVLNVVTNTITLDMLMDHTYTVAATCIRGNREMNVDGSVTPKIFRVTPKYLQAGTAWDITRMMIFIQDATSMDDSKFGGDTALTRGILIRQKNGTIHNIFNAKSNGEMALEMYDTNYTDKAPAGFFGFRARRSFAGQSKNGVAIRLETDTNGEFQIVVQDDLTVLETFRIVVQGHLVQ